MQFCSKYSIVTRCGARGVTLGSYGNGICGGALAPFPFWGFWDFCPNKFLKNDVQCCIFGGGVLTAIKSLILAAFWMYVGCTQKFLTSFVRFPLVEDLCTDDVSSSPRLNSRVASPLVQSGHQFANCSKS